MAAADPSKKAAKPIGAWLAWAASIATVVGIVLGLLGYGVALAAESTFGMPHALLFDSSFELIDLAAVAVGQVLANVTDAVGSLEIYSRVYTQMWPFLVAGVAAWLLFVGIAWKLRKRRMSQPQAVAVVRLAAVRWTSRFPLAYATAVVIGGIATSPLLFGAVLLIMFMLAAAVLSFIPLVGLSAGQAHIRQWVIEPSQCMPTMTLRDRTARPAGTKSKPTNVVECVVVRKDDKELGRGRVVFATHKAVILFEPNTGAVTRIPTSDALVGIVGSL